ADLLEGWDGFLELAKLEEAEGDLVLGVGIVGVVLEDEAVFLHLGLDLADAEFLELLEQVLIVWVILCGLGFAPEGAFLAAELGDADFADALTPLELVGLFVPLIEQF